MNRITAFHFEVFNFVWYIKQSLFLYHYINNYIYFTVIPWNKKSGVLKGIVKRNTILIGLEKKIWRISMQSWIKWSLDLDYYAFSLLLVVPVIQIHMFLSLGRRRLIILHKKKLFPSHKPGEVRAHRPVNKIYQESNMVIVYCCESLGVQNFILFSSFLITDLCVFDSVSTSLILSYPCSDAL